MAAMSPARPHPAIAAYRLRINRRARRIILRVTALGEVEVVAPPRASRADVEQVLVQRRDWLESVLARFARGQAARPAALGLQPDCIQLKALDECWAVRYVPDARRALRPEAASQTLAVAAGLGDGQRSRALQDWLQRRARAILPDWLARVAADTGLAYNRVTIRGQKTRWGSCSAAHNINLNRNLLLVPAPAVRYLLIHELCHTRHLNHSPAYWAEVARHCPEYRQHEAELRRAASRLPLWVHAGRGGG